mmetsp:Transcript_47970/g.133762  ORF Transcript_47970/g.133762 Transcript_47970/m.133762 type:complete len:211 (-) Transcript_47970:1299-1931(-)
MPSKLIWKVTSIFAMPAGAGGKPVRRKVPRRLLSFAKGLSPCKTTTSISSCASAVVVKNLAFLTGMAVFLSTTGVKTPPSVSTPNVNGVTSINIMSCTSPASIAACTAAPMATTSSGSMAVFEDFGPQISFTTSRTPAMRLEPPTNTTSSRLPAPRLVTRASVSACKMGPRNLSKRSSQSSSNFCRLSVTSMCLGPSSAPAMNGTEMLAS